jgi:hypothetical protein
LQKLCGKNELIPHKVLCHIYLRLMQGANCRLQKIGRHLEASVKSSGFNIKETHLTNINRIERLFPLVMVAFAWAYIVEVYLHENLKPLKIKKHGNLTKGFFKYGL